MVLSGRIIHRFSDRIMNHQRSLLFEAFKDRVRPRFRSKRRYQSDKSIFLLYDKPRLHTTAVTTGTLQEMHWEILPHPVCSTDLALSYMFGPLEENKRGKI